MRAVAILSCNTRVAPPVSLIEPVDLRVERFTPGLSAASFRCRRCRRRTTRHQSTASSCPELTERGELVFAPPPRFLSTVSLPQTSVPVVRMIRVAVRDTPRYALPAAFSADELPVSRRVNLAANEQVAVVSTDVTRLELFRFPVRSLFSLS